MPPDAAPPSTTTSRRSTRPRRSGRRLIVLVCGAVPGLPLAEARKQIADGIAAVVDRAAAGQGAAGHRALAPDVRRQPLGRQHARPGQRPLRRDRLAVARGGRRRVPRLVGLRARSPDRALRPRRTDLRLSRLRLANADRRPAQRPRSDGRRLIPIRQIRGWVERHGFDGFNEVEIFSNRLWTTDQGEFLESIKRAYLEYT